MNDLDNPFYLNLARYLFIKYVLSLIILILTLIRIKSIVSSIVLFLIVFFLPNFLILLYKRTQKIYVLNELNIFINSLQVYLLVDNSLYYSLKNSLENLRYKRFKVNLIKFIEEYRIYNYNIQMASKNLLDKFNISELKTFIEILQDNKSIENMIELLNGLKELLGDVVNRNLKIYYIKDNMYIILFIISLLLITFVIVMYPITNQIINNLSIIFN